MEDRKVRVLLEENRQQFKTITEGLAVLLPMKDKVDTIEKKVDILQEDVSLVKLTLSIQSKQINALYEMVAQNTVDIGTIKMKITKIEEEIKIIKNLVKDKADQEKVKKLEANILTLKRKIA